VTAEIRVFNMDSKQKFSTSKKLDVKAGASVKVADLPAIEGLTPVYFLDLRLTDRDGTQRAPSFYWLSTKKDVLDEKGSEWFVTPNKAYADFTTLAQLPDSEVQVTQQLIKSADGRKTIHFALTNPSPVIAFFLELKMVGAKSGKTMLPVLWDDNYISLLPGERRALTATVETSVTGGEEPVVRCAGYNVKPQ
jgi:exo-1,4-beta-D-glucosaminidase